MAKHAPSAKKIETDEGVYTVCSVAGAPGPIKHHGTVEEPITCTIFAYYLCYAVNTATTKNIGQTHSQNRRRFIA